MKRILVIVLIWFVILGTGAALWRYIFAPQKENAKNEQIINQTSGDSRYLTKVSFGLDSFTGNAVFRSPEFQNELSHDKTKINLVDDGGNYLDRLTRLKSGELDMAAFPLDALIKVTAELQKTDPQGLSLPATCVALIDETRGADAIACFKSAFPTIDALNDKDVKFVCVANSPSETISHIIIAHFGLKNLPSNPFIYVDSAEDVYKKYREAKPTDKLVFVTWEPYISKMMENPNVHTLVDSSRFRGYIVDAIVVNRKFLLENTGNVRNVVKAYYKTLYQFTNNDMSTLIKSDIKEGISDKQVERLKNGIWWKNLSENYIHFGLNKDRPLQHIEDMIVNITTVLKDSGAIHSDPTNGKPNALYDPQILSYFMVNNFHPIESVRQDSTDLPELREEQWKKLILVGTLDVQPIVFPRGKAQILDQGGVVLDDLVEKLKSWPHYYIIVRGNSTLVGNLEANKALALSRAKAVEEGLLSRGISKNRVHVVEMEPTGRSEVLFQLGYMPY